MTDFYKYLNPKSFINSLEQPQNNTIPKALGLTALIKNVNQKNHADI